MLKYFNNKSIQFKLLVYFLTLIVFSFILIFVFINIVFSNAMEKAASESTVQAINQANISVESHIRNTENIINLIARNTQVLEFLRSESPEASDDRGIVKSNIRSFLTGFVEYYPEILGIAIINENDHFLSNEMYKVMNEPLTEEDWYTSSKGSFNKIHLIGRPINRNLAHYRNVSADQIVSVIKTVIDPSNDQVIGVILVDLHIKILEDTLKNIKLGKVGFIYVVGPDSEVIYSPINHIVPRVKEQWFSGKTSGIFNKYILGEFFQFIYTTSAYTKWKVVGVFSLNETLKDVVNVRYYLIFILFLVSFIAVGFAVFFSSSMVKPIRELRQLMRKARSGEFSVNFEVKYNDEIGQLGQSFNSMVSEIRKLIDMVYKEQQSKRQAELIMLQSQIKPHFLYNTFDTIHWMAKKYGARDIIQVINALTNLFRIGLSKGSEIIRVGEEIEHARNYLLIQKIRYEDMLDYEIEVEEDIKTLYVQKLVLQPIVENAIYHGIKYKKGPGRIIIKALVKDGSLYFTVSDNGVGIPPEKLEELNNSLKMDNSERLGYGLFNVNERIRLSYGREYGLTIDSIEGSGTAITIKSPVIKSLQRGD